MSFCVGVNRLGTDPNGHEYPGHSAAYDCFGKELFFSKKEGVHLISLNKTPLDVARENFPFLKDRDSFQFNWVGQRSLQIPNWPLLSSSSGKYDTGSGWILFR